MSADRVCARAEAVLLADGRNAVVRPLSVGDRDRLQELFDHTSADNLYTRFFGVGANSVTRHLDHLFSNDAMVHSYVVIGGGRIIGVADVEQLDDTTAEIAFLVADDSHGCGIATLLLERAAGDAHIRGVQWFVADVLAINHLMLKVFTDIGFTVAVRHDGCNVSIRMSTLLDPAARQAEETRAISARARRDGVQAARTTTSR
jgi:GNAT superfamily N-acetyltransferase